MINEDEAFFFASIHSFLDELKGGFVLNLTETRRELKVKEYKMTNDEVMVISQRRSSSNSPTTSTE